MKVARVLAQRVGEVPLGAFGLLATDAALQVGFYQRCLRRRRLAAAVVTEELGRFAADEIGLDPIGRGAAPKRAPQS
jgi:aspartate/glutamate racemase